MGCRDTFALSAKVKVSARWGNSVRLQSHVVAGQPVTKTMAPPYDDEEHEEQEKEEHHTACEKGEQRPDGWRRAHRQLQPEKQGPSLAKLRRAFVKQRPPGVALSARRRPVWEKKAAAAASLEKQNEPADATRRCMRQKTDLFEEEMPGQEGT